MSLVERSGCVFRLMFAQTEGFAFQIHEISGSRQTFQNPTRLLPENSALSAGGCIHQALAWTSKHAPTLRRGAGWVSGWSHGVGERPNISAYVRMFVWVSQTVWQLPAFPPTGYHQNYFNTLRVEECNRRISCSEMQPRDYKLPGSTKKQKDLACFSGSRRSETNWKWYTWKKKIRFVRKSWARLCSQNVN